MSRRDESTLTARRAAQRLHRPGVLDRTPVEQRYERPHQGAVVHELTDRLHQRAEAAGEAGGTSFVWRRSPAAADASADGLMMPVTSASVPTAPPIVPATSSTPLSRTTAPVVQRAALPEPEAAAMTARLTSRAQSSGLLAAGSTISRPAAAGVVGDAPSFAVSLQSRYGVTLADAAGASAPVRVVPASSLSSAPATGVIRRQAETSMATSRSSSHDGAGALPTLSGASRGLTAAPMPAHETPAGSPVASARPLMGTGSFTALDSPAAGSLSRPGMPVAHAARPPVPAASAAGSPLVLRRMLAAPVSSGTVLPGVLPPAAVQAPREETLSPLPPRPAPPTVKEVKAPAGADIDRIAEEVGRRLMRRLEIERERRGIRQWR
jgi:hypothetical protein